jgi:hypothetical protein
VLRRERILPADKGVKSLAIADGTIAESGSAVAVFRDDTLDDLARLIRPLNISALADSGSTVHLYLRDAIYAGAVGGRAQLVTLWVTSDTNDKGYLLAHGDSARKLSDIAAALAQNPLAPSAFVLLRVEAVWKEWTLTISRIGDPVVNAAPGAISDLSTAIRNSSPTLALVDTRSVAIPIGYGLTKLTGMASWFDSDQVVVSIVPVPFDPSLPSRPDVLSLHGKAGLIVGQGFLNDVFSRELGDRIWVTSVAGKTYRVRDLRFAAQSQTLFLSSNLLDVPDPATVVVSATLSGDDLKPTKITGSVDCKTLEVGKCLSLEGEVNVATAALTLKLTNQQKPLRPDGIQQLGNFSIGTKSLYGITRIDDMQAAQGTIVLFSVFRFQGGSLL